MLRTSETHNATGSILNKIQAQFSTDTAKGNFTRRETRLGKGGQICFASVSICIIIKFISFIHFIPFHSMFCYMYGVRTIHAAGRSIQYIKKIEMLTSVEVEAGHIHRDREIQRDRGRQRGRGREREREEEWKRGRETCHSTVSDGLCL